MKVYTHIYNHIYTVYIESWHVYHFDTYIGMCIRIFMDMT